MKINRRSPFAVFRTVRFESLEPRQLLSINVAAGEFGNLMNAHNPPTSETIRLAAFSNEEIKSQYVELTNESDFKARFSMTFNGNISRNIQHLVEQIRAMSIPGDADMPDYRRAYFYVMQYHQHDFPFTRQLWTHEPSLYLNSIGSGFCDDAATSLKLIWQEMGYQSRIWLLNGHVVAEIHTGERWEMYDADLKVMYYKRDGRVAGVEELAASPSLIRNPTNPTSANSYVYSPRMASIYSSTENNKICTVCDDYVVQRDLIFEIPAGGAMSWGQIYTTKPLPIVVIDTPTKLGQLKLTIPAGSTGTLDIPLAIYDIEGSGGDSVSMSGEMIRLGSDDIFEFLNRETPLGNRVQTIEFDNLAQPIDVIYLFNERFATLLQSNKIGIYHVTTVPAVLCASIKRNEATKWDFGAGEKFNGLDQHLDLSDEKARQLISANSSFEINARIKLDDGDTSRRPVFDAFRFSVEVDAQDRPYVYFRQATGLWAGIRGEALSSGEWHDLKVNYHKGNLSLTVDGHLIGFQAAQRMNSSYPLIGPFIGRSEHVGGLYFKGEMSLVSIHQIFDEGARPDFHTIPLNGIEGNKTHDVRGDAVASVSVTPMQLDRFFSQVITSTDEKTRLEGVNVDAVMTGRTKRIG